MDLKLVEQSLLNGSTMSSWRAVSSGGPQVSVLSLMLSNSVINDLDDGVQGMLIKFAGVGITLEDRIRIQNNVHRFRL